MTVEDLEKIETIEADLMEYVNRKRSEWIVNGNIDEEWDAYLAELDRFRLPEWLEIKQKYFDEYLANQE